MSNKTSDKYTGMLGMAMQKIKGVWPWYKGLYKGRAW